MSGVQDAKLRAITDEGLKKELEEVLPEPEPEGGVLQEDRIEFVRFSARRDAERCTCDVTLRDDGREIAGSGSGPDTAIGRAEAAARAVFDGIAAARPDIVITLDSAVISTSRGRDFVIVSAHVVQDRDSIRLAGAAPLARSPEEAAILAALQATNRWSA